MNKLVESMCIALIGLPGSGKSHLKKKVLSIYPNIKALIPMTTRKPRGNEVNGRDKYFVSEAEFMKKKSAGDLFLEIETYSQKSGFSKLDLCDHQCYISEFYYKDVQSLVNVFRKCIFILIMPINTEVLISNLCLRDAEAKETEARLDSIKEEIMQLEEMHKLNAFDFVFINSYDKNSEDTFIDIIDNITKDIIC